jgi:hypothetical protein
VVKIRASPQRREHFYQQCIATNLPELELIPDIVTHWNSTDIMLERALKLRKALDNIALTIKDLIRYRLSDNFDYSILRKVQILLQVTFTLLFYIVFLLIIIY